MQCSFIFKYSISANNKFSLRLIIKVFKLDSEVVNFRFFSVVHFCPINLIYKSYFGDYSYYNYSKIALCRRDTLGYPDEMLYL